MVLRYRVIIVFPTVEIFVAKKARYVVRMGFGRVEIKPGIGKLNGNNQHFFHWNKNSVNHSTYRCRRRLFVRPFPASRALGASNRRCAPSPVEGRQAVFVYIHVLTFRHCCKNSGLLLERREKELRAGNWVLFECFSWTIGAVDSGDVVVLQKS